MEKRPFEFADGTAGAASAGGMTGREGRGTLSPRSAFATLSAEPATARPGAEAGSFSTVGCGPTGEGTIRPPAGFASGTEAVVLSGPAGTAVDTGRRANEAVATITGAPVLWKSITSRYGL